MIKKYLFTILILFFFNSAAFSAGNSNDSGGKKVTNYQSAYNSIKRAEKLEKKNKIKKAKKLYKKALKSLLKANEENPVDPDTFNYLGFTNRKLGNFVDAEIYYLLGLEIDPNHNGINEYLGELYVNTNRLDKAKERLKILEKCNCEEFEELKQVIKSGSSKY